MNVWNSNWKLPLHSLEWFLFDCRVSLASGKIILSGGPAITEDNYWREKNKLVTYFEVSSDIDSWWCYGN